MGSLTSTSRRPADYGRIPYYAKTLQRMGPVEMDCTTCGERLRFSTDGIFGLTTERCRCGWRVIFPHQPDDT